MDTLPFLTRLVAATILAKQNKTLIAEIAYLRAEISFLRDQLPAGTTLRFTDRWRKRLARAAAGVGWQRVAEIATVAKGTTLRGWHRLMQRGKLGVKRAPTGRPRVSDEIEKLVVRLATESVRSSFAKTSWPYSVEAAALPRTSGAARRRIRPSGFR